MKTTLVLCALAVFAVSNAAVVQAPVSSRVDLNQGYCSDRDRLLNRQYLYKEAVPSTIQYEDMVYRGNRNTRICAIQAFEVGYSQFASARVISGGIGQRNAIVRVQSARGYGYYYQVEIWGR